MQSSKLFFILVIACAVSASKLAQLQDMLNRYDPITGKMKDPVHLNFAISGDSFTGIVIPKHCNIYEGPGVSYEVVGVLSQFDKVKVKGDVVFTEDGEEARHEWFKIGKDEYIMQQYIFNPQKANIDEDSSDSDIIKDEELRNVVVKEKPKIEELKEDSVETFNSIADKDPSEKIINSIEPNPEEDKKKNEEEEEEEEEEEKKPEEEKKSEEEKKPEEEEKKPDEENEPNPFISDYKPVERVSVAWKQTQATPEPSAPQPSEGEAAKTTGDEAAKTAEDEAAKTTEGEAAKTTEGEAAKTTEGEAAKTTEDEAAKTGDEKVSG